MIASNIKLIGFDLDDTLWPCMPTIIKAENSLYDWLSQHYPHITHRYSMTSMMGMRKDFILKNPQLKVNLNEMRAQFLKYLARQCHYPEDDIAERGLAVFMQERNQVTLYDDVIPVLSELSKQYHIASISNGNADVYQTGIGPYLNYSINASDLNSAKPEQALFRHVEQQSGFDAEQCLYIGDNVDMDIVGARNASWDCIWLNRDNKTWPDALGQPPAIIHTLTSLL